MFLLKLLFMLSTSSEALGRTSAERIWSLPQGVIRENVLDQLSWQGLDMRAETLHIPMPIELFTEELAHLIPAHSSMTRVSGGLLFSWIHDNVSYLLTVQNEINDSTGFLSSLSLIRSHQHIANTSMCSRRWLPENLRSLFSVRDAVRTERLAWIDAYVSEPSVDLTYARMIHRLKAGGWIIVGSDVSDVVSQNIFSIRALCGHIEMSIDIHKDVAQAHILVSRVE